MEPIINIKFVVQITICVWMKYSEKMKAFTLSGSYEKTNYAEAILIYLEQSTIKVSTCRTVKLQ